MPLLLLLLREILVLLLQPLLRIQSCIQHYCYSNKQRSSPAQVLVPLLLLL
jgi:hypothetical protein